MTEPNQPPHLRLVSEEDDLDDVLLDDADVEAALAREEELRKLPLPHIPKRRQFTRVDVSWRRALMAADPPVTGAVWRLSMVLLERADFDREITVNAEVLADAGLTASHKRDILERLERLGLIAVEWRGRRVPIVTPLRLGGRPGRR